MVSYSILLSLFLCPISSSIKIFDFVSSVDSSLNYVSLDSSVSLPSKFTFCGSFKQKSVRETGFFTIYGEDRRPWISISLWRKKTEISIWLSIWDKWIKIGAVRIFTLNFWNHLCLMGDTNSGHIAIAYNELFFEIKNQNFNKHPPTQLKGKLVIGTVEDPTAKGPRQFEGMVANVKLLNNIQNTGQLKIKIKNLCEEEIKSFATLFWTKSGNVKEYEEDAWKICNGNQTYTIAVDARLEFQESLKKCLHLWSGNMLYVRPEKCTRARSQTLNS